MTLPRMAGCALQSTEGFLCCVYTRVVCLWRLGERQMPRGRGRIETRDGDRGAAEKAEGHARLRNARISITRGFVDGLI